jgi:signal transduction histidine kinase
VSKEISQLNKFYTLSYGQKDYLTFITPIKKDDTTYGYVLLSKSSQLQNDFNRLALFILPPIIILSSLLGWFFSSKLTTFLLSPLENLITLINTSDYHNLLSVLNPNTSPDHLSRLQTSYNSMVSRLTKGYQEQKLFISRASHEFKTPLANLLSTVELLELDIQDKKLSNLTPRLTQIKKILHTQSRQVDDLLNISNLSYSNIDYEAISIYDFFQSLINQFQKDIAEKSLIVNNQTNPEVTIFFPKKYLLLIFQNLVSNAIKYNKPNGSINLLASKTGDTFSLSITDTGHGINSDDLAHIFDPFFRSSATSRSVTGSGIGLNLVKQICDQYGLVISATSQPDIYTTITISGFKSPDTSI